VGRRNSLQRGAIRASCTVHRASCIVPSSHVDTCITFVYVYNRVPPRHRTSSTATSSHFVVRKNVGPGAPAQSTRGYLQAGRLPHRSYAERLPHRRIPTVCRQVGGKAIQVVLWESKGDPCHLYLLHEGIQVLVEGRRRKPDGRKVRGVED
jgi:hypothetical protein